MFPVLPLNFTNFDNVFDNDNYNNNNLATTQYSAPHTSTLTGIDKILLNWKE